MPLAHSAPRNQATSAAPAWTQTAFLAGGAGAATVALFFLLIDLLAGRPFWTPGALGAALFTGTLLPVDATPGAIFVVAYTAVHVAVFVAYGFIAASYLASRDRPELTLTGREAVGLVTALFLACEVIFLAFAFTFAPGLVEAFGAGNVGLSNMLAALAMTAVLTRAKFSGRVG